MVPSGGRRGGYAAPPVLFRRGTGGSLPLAPSPLAPPTRSRPHHHARGLLVTAAGVLVLSPDALQIRLADAGTWEVVFWRTLFIAVSLGLGLTVRYRTGLAAVIRGGGRPMLASSLLFGATSIAFVAAITHTRVANALVILSTAPLFAAIGTRAVASEGVPPRTWTAAVLAAGGIGVQFVGAVGGGRVLGDLLAVLTALLLAANLIVLREGRARDMLPAAGIGSLLAAIVAGIVSWPVAVSAGSMGVLALMGLLQVPLALTLVVSGTRLIPAPEVGLLMLLETVLGPLWAWIGVGETPGLPAVLGGGIVVATLAGHSALGLGHRTPSVPADRG